MTQHPITPSPELRDRWRQAAPLYQNGAVDRENWLIDSAAQWGLNQCRRLPDPAYFLGVPLIPPADCTDSQSWIAMRIYQMGRDQRGKDIERERQEAALRRAQPEPTLTVEDCDNMHKHRFNFLYEDFTGEIVLDGSFTREDLIEIANTVPPTEV
jgi:hypothetical protein